MILVGWVGINVSSLIRLYVHRIRLSLFKCNTKWTALRSKSTQTNPPWEKTNSPLGRPSSIRVTINNQRRSKGTKRLKTRHIPFWFFARVISFSLHLFLSHFISIIFEREREREDQSFSAIYLITIWKRGLQQQQLSVSELEMRCLETHQDKKQRRWRVGLLISLALAST